MLLHKPLVASVDDALGPVGERLPYKRIGYVDQPLSRQLAEFLCIRQVVDADISLQCLLEDLLDTQALVLWYSQVSDLVVTDVLLDALDERFQKVDGVTLVRGQVCVALDSQEVEPTASVIDMGNTYTSRFDRYLAANV